MFIPAAWTPPKTQTRVGQCWEKPAEIRASPERRLEAALALMVP